MDIFEWTEETPVTANNLNEMQNILNDNMKSIKQKYILASTSTATSNFSKITLNTIVLKQGDFTLNDGNVVIPSGISLIRVSGGIMADVSSNTRKYLWGQIKQNNTVISSNMSAVNGDDYVGCSIPPTLIEVAEGDIISLTANNTCEATNRTGRANTWLLIEEIVNY